MKLDFEIKLESEFQNITLSEKKRNVVNPNGRLQQPAGGVAILIRKDIKFNKIDTSEFNEEFLAKKLQITR